MLAAMNFMSTSEMQPYEASKASSGKWLMSSASCSERRSVSYSSRKSFARCNIERIEECNDNPNAVCRDMDFSLTGMGNYFYSDPWYNFEANEGQTAR
jgi:hypothetical protein